MHTEHLDVVVIGAGPAGLAATESLVAAGLQPVLFEAMPSAGRKFLMAGKSGLNLTKDEAGVRFADTIGCPEMTGFLADFGPKEVVAWAQTLGEEVFTGSSGRVFPVAMKASPLLRRWLARLSEGEAKLRTRWKWTGWTPDDALEFETPSGSRSVFARAVVLALGGASWPRLGSDASWVPALAAETPIAPFRPSNMGFDVAWTPIFADRFAGSPVKPVRLSAGGHSVHGEFVVTRNGIEGSAIYAISAPLRDILEAGEGGLTVDLAPDLKEAELADRIARPRGKASWASHLRRTLRLQGVKAGLLREAGPLSDTPEMIAHRIKATRIPVTKPRPLQEAISSAGGVRWEGLTKDLMRAARPGVFVAGEMLDWEAPTGGYLITACLATGRRAGAGAAAWLAQETT
ncbi:MAG: TIGR03862 family flavoprotein [Paracoccaceae bacterium]